MKGGVNIWKALKDNDYVHPCWLHCAGRPYRCAVVCVLDVFLACRTLHRLQTRTRTIEWCVSSKHHVLRHPPDTVAMQYHSPARRVSASVGTPQRQQVVLCD